ILPFHSWHAISGAAAEPRGNESVAISPHCPSLMRAALSPRAFAKRWVAMIPEKIVDFMHGGVLSWVGTRDARLRPALTWAFGVRVGSARDEIPPFVPAVEIDQTRSNLSLNDLVALNVVQPITHEAYQFK